MDQVVEGSLGALESLALSKGVSAWLKAQEETDLPVGEHSVSAQYLVNVTGTLTRAEDTSKKATSSIPWKLFAAVLSEKCGITGEPAMRMITDSLVEAMDLRSDKKQALSELLLYVERAEQRVEKMIAALPRTPVKGALTADLDVTVERVVSVNAVGSRSARVASGAA